jgi:hypothetical protein
MVGRLDEQRSWRTYTGRDFGGSPRDLIDAVRMIREPVDLSKLPKSKIRIEQLEV